MCGYQKTIRTQDDRKKRFFITIYVYDYRDIPLDRRPADLTFGFSPEVHLYRGTEESYETLIVQYYVENTTTVQKLEAFYQEVYDKLGCIPDVHNN